ncbi:MAG: hypothetical protein Q7W45_16270 [Bacteroidota bacterium]|nr:hypothetical protein [Bacteroidota bacterium]MDP3145428.1 hypothetical protein [Bacteroidota bacterium]MDP3557205.1 hypothetical protein [Bacteroidota bacterium]
MKKIAFITLVALAFCFASCKKDRTCTCTYYKSWASSSETQITNYSNVSKKTALATCNSGNSYDPTEPNKVEVRNCSLN